MVRALEPVHFPAEHFHALFKIALAGQEPWPIVDRFLLQASAEGLINSNPIVGRELTPLGFVALLADGRRRAWVFVSVDEKRYATPFTFFPSADNLRRWYRLAKAIGDVRVMGSSEEEGDSARVISLDPEGIRWCPRCTGMNLLPAARCVWCRDPLPPARNALRQPGR